MLPLQQDGTYEEKSAPYISLWYLKEGNYVSCFWSLES